MKEQNGLRTHSRDDSIERLERQLDIPVDVLAWMPLMQATACQGRGRRGRGKMGLGAWADGVPGLTGPATDRAEFSTSLFGPVPAVREPLPLVLSCEKGIASGLMHSLRSAFVRTTATATFPVP